MEIPADSTIQSHAGSPRRRVLGCPGRAAGPGRGSTPAKGDRRPKDLADQNRPARRVAAPQLLKPGCPGRRTLRSRARRRGRRTGGKPSHGGRRRRRGLDRPPARTQRVPGDLRRAGRPALLPGPRGLQHRQARAPLGDLAKDLGPNAPRPLVAIGIARGGTALTAGARLAAVLRPWLRPGCRVPRARDHVEQPHGPGKQDDEKLGLREQPRARVG